MNMYEKKHKKKTDTLKPSNKFMSTFFWHFTCFVEIVKTMMCPD